MDEKEYNNRCDELFSRIETMLDDCAADFDSNGNVIEIETEDGGTIIINRQPAVFEVWLAYAGGGHHFKWRANTDDDKNGDDGSWQDTRSGDNLMTMLQKLVQ